MLRPGLRRMRRTWFQPHPAGIRKPIQKSTYRRNVYPSNVDMLQRYLDSRGLCPWDELPETRTPFYSDEWYRLMLIRLENIGMRLRRAMEYYEVAQSASTNSHGRHNSLRLHPRRCRAVAKSSLRGIAYNQDRFMRACRTVADLHESQRPDPHLESKVRHLTSFLEQHPVQRPVPDWSPGRG
ncbi:uncharacterized protein LOC111252951 [Varroa destructor]|uniref:Uncharacterized protein n=1 Tax=Varroa destructor TaxID=109461 RepID=A0A7M7KY09_VARDE|nr:uncharacterized protein LOC111252951 [Varroa destructor]